MASAADGLVSYGAVILLKQLNIIQQEIPGIRTGEDIEYLHRTRVASRRMRAALPLFAPSISAHQAPKWKRTFRTLTQALGQARDSDVQIEVVNAYLQDLPQGPERPGVRRLLLRLHQRRAKLQRSLLAALDEFEQSGVPERMHKILDPLAPAGALPANYSDSLYFLAHGAIAEKRQLLLDFEPYVFQPEAVQELHAMRIAAKRLRYTLEIFAPLYTGELKSYLQSVRSAQEMLGQIHDSDVWLQSLPQFVDEEQRRTLRYFGSAKPFRRLFPGLVAFECSQRAVRDRQYHKFTATWQEWQTGGLWDQLLDSVQPPAGKDSQDVQDGPAPENERKTQ